MVQSDSEPLACLIAAGGTAGHVAAGAGRRGRAERRGALRSRFAGSPDRFEARLVPAAGFELDPFASPGFPRRPGSPLLRASRSAVARPRRLPRDPARRRPDVVLGGGGYVAGPMVLAAGLRRIPAALTEADAHLGLANRLAVPFARRVFLSFPIAGRREPKYVLTGRPVPERAQPRERAEARRVFGLPESGAALLVLAMLNEGTRHKQRQSPKTRSAAPLSGSPNTRLASARSRGCARSGTGRPVSTYFGSRLPSIGNERKTRRANGAASLFARPRCASASVSAAGIRRVHAASTIGPAT